METKKTNKKFTLILGSFVVLGLIYGIYKFNHAQGHEETDDAQIEQNMTPIIPRVGGYISNVFVKDNQIVKKGDTLFIIDNKDYLVKVNEAEAALLAAKSSFEVSKADVDAAAANISISNATIQSNTESIEMAKVRLERASNDFERYSNLYKNQSITKQQYEQAWAAKQEALKQVEMLKQQKIASANQKNAVVSKTTVASKQTHVANANINRAQAAYDAAKLNLSYTIITASVDGQVSNIDIQVGQLVQPGQALFYLVNNQDTWVVANFKETQLNKMREGQKVTLEVDAYPDDSFEGEIVSFSPATGSKFSILPPDNATGNFVKTVQRLPVKIKLSNSNDKEKVKLLRPGMNVFVDVHVK